MRMALNPLATSAGSSVVRAVSNNTNSVLRQVGVKRQVVCAEFAGGVTARMIDSLT